jgi:UDP-N-acetylglucosamine 2-epimerase (non-hydrolysing)
MVLVQGDTTSAFAAALAAFHRRIVVGQVEAGLRHVRPVPAVSRGKQPQDDLLRRGSPSRATSTSAENLRREGIKADEILITGNTVIDSLLDTLARPDLLETHRLRDLPIGPSDPLVLITLHRRENYQGAGSSDGGSALEDVLLGIRDAAESVPKARFVYPVHRNPRVQEPARRILGGRSNIHLIDPVSYIPFVDLMSRATVILTDSGGIQEEAPSLGVPVLVARETTERPEAVATGANRMVGTDRAAIAAELRRHLEHPVRRPGSRPFPSRTATAAQAPGSGRPCFTASDAASVRAISTIRTCPERCRSRAFAQQGGLT